MMPARIYETPRGILVKATARDFPCLAALEPFLADVAAIQSQPLVGAIS